MEVPALHHQLLMVTLLKRAREKTMVVIEKSHKS